VFKNYREHISLLLMTIKIVEENIMKLIVAFTVSLIMSGSVFARDDFAKASSFREPVIHEIAIKDVPALSKSKSLGNIITTQVIDWGGQCLWHDDDIDVTFGIPTIPGYTMVSANIKLNYADADFNDVSVWDEPEVDIVGIGDSSLSVDVLKGKNGEVATASWSVLNQIEHDSASGSLGFQVNIDALHNNNHWCLVVNTATLTTRWK